MSITLAEKIEAFIKANFYKTREAAFEKLAELNSAKAITGDQYTELAIIANKFYDDYDALPEVEKLKLVIQEQANAILLLNESLTGFVEYLFLVLPELNPTGGVQ